MDEITEKTQTDEIKTKPKKDVKKKLKEKSGNAFAGFKKFAFRGNIVDLAIAVIIGAAFGKIITSLVSDVIMPALGVLIGDVDFTSFRIILKKGDPNADPVVPETAIRYGQFIQTIFEFFIIALSIYLVFIIIKRVQKLAEHKKEATPPPPPPALTKSEELLTDIKNLLTEQKNGVILETKEETKLGKNS